MTDLRRSIQLSELSNLLIIDGDAIPWMIGWHHREHRDTSAVLEAVDQWMGDFLDLTRPDAYVGYLAPAEGACFRKEVYKYKPYKGNRPPREDWILHWEPIIRAHLLAEYGFMLAPSHLETDDMVALLAHDLRDTPEMTGAVYICSPDKDLRQIPGHHLDYRKLGEEGGGLLQVDVSEQEARRNLCRQLLTGDSTDNIAGVPKMGPVKAEKLLNETDEMLWMTSVRLEYNKYFGDYYGQIIFAETQAAIQLMTPEHPLWNSYGMVKKVRAVDIQLVEDGRVYQRAQ